MARAPKAVNERLGRVGGAGWSIPFRSGSPSSGPEGVEDGRVGELVALPHDQESTVQRAEVGEQGRDVGDVLRDRTLDGGDVREDLREPSPQRRRIDHGEVHRLECDRWVVLEATHPCLQ